MNSYRYQALDGSGDRKQGLRVAHDKATLRSFLKQRGFTPLSIEKDRSFRAGPIYHKQALSRLFRNIGMFLQGGMELIPALRQVRNRLDNSLMKASLETVVDDMESGRSFGDSLASCEPYIPEEAHRLCSVGEQTGRLDVACNQLSRFYRSQYDFLSEMYQMMIYPIVVTFAGVGVLVFLFVFVLPRLRMLLQNRLQSLPWPTRVLFLGSSYLQGWTLLLTMIVLGLVGWVAWRGIQSDTGRRWQFRLLLTSSIYQKMKMNLFCMAMAMSTEVGLNIGRALELGKNVLRNPYLKERMDDVKQDVRSGQPLTESLERHGFTILPLDSLAVGEKTGNLPRVFRFQAELLGEEVRNSLKRVTTLFEPAMILVMTLFVGMVLLAVMWPIINMTTSF